MSLFSSYHYKICLFACFCIIICLFYSFLSVSRLHCIFFISPFVISLKTFVLLSVVHCFMNKNLKNIVSSIFLLVKNVNTSIFMSSKDVSTAFHVQEKMERLQFPPTKYGNRKILFWRFSEKFWN